MAQKLTLVVASDRFPYGSDRPVFSLIFTSNKISCFFKRFEWMKKRWKVLNTGQSESI